MERLGDFCTECGELPIQCSCYFLVQGVLEDNIPFKFEYAFEHLTEETSVFKRKHSDYSGVD